MEIRRQMQPGCDLDTVKQLKTLTIIQKIEGTGQVVTQLGIEVSQAKGISVSTLKDTLPTNADAVELPDGTGLFVGNAKPTEDTNALV